MNYIKGWRYQLYCEAKAVRTPSVVLQIGVSKQRAQAVNEARLRRRRAATGSDETPEENTPDLPEVTLAETDTEEPYEPENWDNLVFRYEEPNPMTRWDSPLFALVWDDDEAQTRKVFDDVWEAIAGEGRGAVKPNRATVQRGREAGGDYLYVLDRETQDVVRRILEAQQEGAGGGEAVRVPRGGTAEAGEEEQLVVQLPGTRLGLPQLQRLRRAFVGLNRGGIGLEGVGDLGVARMRESFVGYLNDAFDKDE
jgi:protein KTI12